MAKFFFILLVAGALGEGMRPSQPPLLIDAAPSPTHAQ